MRKYIFFAQESRKLPKGTYRSRRVGGRPGRQTRLHGLSERPVFPMALHSAKMTRGLARTAARET